MFVDRPHILDLYALFHFIFLIKAERVYPEPFTSIPQE